MEKKRAAVSTLRLKEKARLAKRKRVSSSRVAGLREQGGIPLTSRVKTLARVKSDFYRKVHTP